MENNKLSQSSQDSPNSQFSETYPTRDKFDETELVSITFLDYELGVLRYDIGWAIIYYQSNLLFRNVGLIKYLIPILNIIKIRRLG